MMDVRKQLLIWLPTLTVAAVFLIYLRTLLPGIGYSGDTAKFQFVGKVLGTPHEPGSPTYVMLNYLFVTIFPIGATGFKANLFSAITSMLCLWVLSRSLILLGVRPFITACTATVFGFTYSFWSQSVIAEVYSLNILFIAVTLYYFIRWHLLGKYKHFLYACAFYSFSFGDHLIVVTLLPAIIFLVWATQKDYFTKPRIIVHVAVLILLGALQYGYLFWRAYAHDTSYLEIAVMDLKDLWHCASGGQFQDKLIDGGINRAFFIRMPVMIRFAWLEYSVLLPIALLGFFFIRDISLKVFLILCSAGTFVFTCMYGIPDIFIYMIPVYYVLALTLGISLERLASRCTMRYVILLQLSLVCMPGLFLALNDQKVNQSNNVNAKALVEQSLKSIGGKSFIVCPNYDWGEFFWYYVFAEGYQQDSVYAFYPHNNDMPVESLESYVGHGKPFYLPVQRCNLPAGLTAYICTAMNVECFDRSRTRYPSADTLLRHVGDPTMIHMIKDGFQFTQVGIDMYRIDKPSH
jgi:hypothetical protein